jgi:hypothetical protein
MGNNVRTYSSLVRRLSSVKLDIFISIVNNILDINVDVPHRLIFDDSGGPIPTLRHSRPQCGIIALGVERLLGIVS